MFDYDIIMPYVRIASLLMHTRIGLELSCMHTPYALHCDFPSPSMVCELMCTLLKYGNIDMEEIPTFISCTVQLWNRMLRHTKLHFSCWEVTMCCVFNIVGKILDDEWFINCNGVICQKLNLDLNIFNQNESAVLVALNYDIRLCKEKLRTFIYDVQDIHTRAGQYIAKDYRNLIDICKKATMAL
jgi:hypothetical protein